MAFFVCFASAQQANIDFEETEYNFGAIDELGGSVSHRFVFTNTGDIPLIINSVHTSCGCTSPAWSQEPIQAGKKGYIDVTFDPRDRTGAFTKSIIVNSSAQEQSITLYIGGIVSQRPAQISAEYPYSILDLRLKTKTANFGNIQKNSSADRTIEVFNPTKADIVVGSGSNPEYITIEPKPKIIKPGQKGIIKIKFDAKSCPLWDYILVPAQITVNTYPHEINIKAVVTEIFTEKQKSNPPILKLNSGTTLDFGTIEKDGIAVKKINFTNTGSSPLIIRAIRNSNDCLTFKFSNTEIQPGQSADIQVFFNAEGKHGNQNRYFSIITNTPQNTNTIIKTIAKIDN